MQQKECRKFCVIAILRSRKHSDLFGVFLVLSTSIDEKDNEDSKYGQASDQCKRVVGNVFVKHVLKVNLVWCREDAG